MGKNLYIWNEDLLSVYKIAKALTKRRNGRRIATLEDIITIRAQYPKTPESWETWFTSGSTIYIGTSSKGEKLIVIAHHLGPLTTIKRVEKFTKSALKEGGRTADGWKGCRKITQEEFDALIEGKYGKVDIFPLEQYEEAIYSLLRSGHYPIDLIRNNPLLKSLLGRSGEQFIEKHLEISRAYAKKKRKEEGAGEIILTVNLEDNHGLDVLHTFDQKYFKKVEWPTQPIAGFLCLENPSHWGNKELSISTEIDWESGGRSAKFIILTGEGNTELQEIKTDPLLNQEKCLVDNPAGEKADFFSLIKKGEKFFVETPKIGDRLDTGEIKYPVNSIEKIGKESSFITTDIMFFLKYDINEVKAVAPKGANAYLIIGSVSPGDRVEVPVQFYHIEIDTSKRILSPEELYNNFELLCEINGIK
ncbi:MAG: hypothetical protein LBD11_06590 [Candidatus Peribacteria bacterium]|jgi:hypothetical protein|nr:hypothetical protein [Candidatus Peribacteria bacterium]